DPAVPDALSLLGGWDTSWYLDIARHGYDDYLGLVGVFFSNLAFFPLLPALMKGALVLGLNPFLAALVVTNLAFLAALAGFHLLSAERYGEAFAHRATWALALVPPAAYASLAYTDGIVLALAVAVALAARRGWWLLAGVAAALATLARPPGVLVALLAVAIALVGDPPPGGAGAVPPPEARRVRLRWAAWALAPSVVAMLAFLGWMQVSRGSWGLPFAAQGAWDRAPLIIGLVTHLPAELAEAVAAVVTLDVSAEWTATVRDVGFTALYGLLLARLWRMEGGWRSPWVLYSAGALALPLSSGSFTSMARFGLIAFPLAWAGASWLAEGGPRRRRATAAAAVVVTGLLVAQLLIRSP
ncbi:MAG TPA: hypothetical protein VNT51_12080, partial [Miltoncostaeaceae bacterium]|nr:hypothetical protein [Miltoncostaeaceae bacterium]